MPEESEYEVGSPAGASKAVIDVGTEIADMDRFSVAQGLFDVAGARLLGIQLRGIGQESYAVQPAILGIS